MGPQENSSVSPDKWVLPPYYKRLVIPNHFFSGFTIILVISPFSAFKVQSSLSPSFRSNWCTIPAGTVVRRDSVIVDALVIVVLNPILIRCVYANNYLILANSFDTFTL